MMRRGEADYPKMNATERSRLVLALGCEFHEPGYSQCAACVSRAEQVWDDAVTHIVAERTRQVLRHAATDLERRAGDFKMLPGDKHVRRTHNEIASWLRHRAVALDGGGSDA